MDTDTNVLGPKLAMEQISPTLWEIHDVFHEEYLAYLDRYTHDTNVWIMNRAESRISSPIDNTSKPFDAAGRALLPTVSQHLSVPLQYSFAKMFLDFAGSSVPMHTDQPGIAVMCQIYLTAGDFTIPGTVFMDPTLHTVKFRRNHGYVNLNIDAKNHMSPKLTTGVRVSLALQYKHQNPK
jgi:hypothetical protein